MSRGWQSQQGWAPIAPPPCQLAPVHYSSSLSQLSAQPSANELLNFAEKLRNACTSVVLFLNEITAFRSVKSMCRPKLIFDGCHNLELRDRNLEKSFESNKSVDVVQYFSRYWPSAGFNGASSRFDTTSVCDRRTDGRTEFIYQLISYSV